MAAPTYVSDSRFGIQLRAPGGVIIASFLNQSVRLLLVACAWLLLAGRGCVHSQSLGIGAPAHPHASPAQLLVRFA